MTKFRCIKGTDDFPVGTIIEAERAGKDLIRITKDSTIQLSEGVPFFGEGEIIPLTGYAYQWVSHEGEPDRGELLERFEVAVDVLATYGRDILEYGESDIDHSKAEQEYESAKAELLKRLS